jgi:hypothetical protein
MRRRVGHTHRLVVAPRLAKIDLFHIGDPNARTSSGRSVPRLCSDGVESLTDCSEGNLPLINPEAASVV